MPTHSFTITERFSTEPGEVLSLESDAARWREWAPPPFSSVRWQADDSVDGEVGAVRELVIGPLAVRERTTVLEPGAEHAYSMLPRWPFHAYGGRVSVRNLDGGGGELVWTCSFRVSNRVVGAVAARLMAAAISVLARRLVTEADRRATITRRPSLQSRLQRAGLRLVVRPALSTAPFDLRWIRVLRGVSTRAARLAGSRRRARPADGTPVPGLWIDGPADAPGLLVLHGGGYVSGSPDTHATMAVTLAGLAGATAYVPDYRLAPEYQYPAALDDAETAFRHLAEQVGGPERVAVAGDSAGGGLALALLDRLRARGEQPACLALISPWVDLTEPLGKDRSRGVLDPLTPPRIAGDCRDAYAGDTPADDPGISPGTRALDATAPPVAIVCGGDDFVVDDVRAFVDTSAGCGAAIELRVWPGMVHCFPVVAGTPEGASALAVLAAQIRKAM